MERRGKYRREKVCPEKAKEDRLRFKRNEERQSNGKGSSTGTKGAAMKQTNTERAGRGCRGARAAVEGRR